MLTSHDPPDTTVEILTNPNRTIRSCEDLEIFGSRTRTMKLVDALQHLPNLTPSFVRLVSWPPSNRQTRAYLPLFPSVRRLCLLSMRPDNLDGLLVSFPNACEIEMERCSVSDTALYIGSHLVPSLQLCSLELVYCTLDPLLRYFLRRRIVPTGHLHIKYLSSHDIAIVGEYFSKLGHVLQDVRIGLYYDCDGTRYPPLDSALYF